MSIIFKARHGTITDMPAFNDEGHIASCLNFDGLSPDHKDAKTSAVYFTDHESEDVCNMFAEEKYSSPELQAKTIVAATIRANKVFEMDRTPMGGVDLNGRFYAWPDERNDFYDKLREDGYDAVVISAGYRTTDGKVSPDIAVLDGSIIEVEAVKMKIEGKWTSYLDKREATLLLEQMAIKSENCIEFNNDLKPDSGVNDFDNANGYDDMDDFDSDTTHSFY